MGNTGVPTVCITADVKFAGAGDVAPVYRCCYTAARVSLKLRASAGWNRPARCVQDGTPTEAYTRISTAPFVAVVRKNRL